MNFLNKARKKAEQAFNEIQGVALNKPPHHGQQPHPQPGYGVPAPQQNMPPPPTWQAHQFPDLLPEHGAAPLQQNIFYPPPETQNQATQHSWFSSPDATLYLTTSHHSPPQPQTIPQSSPTVSVPQTYSSPQPSTLGPQHQAFSPPALSPAQTFPLAQSQAHALPAQQPIFPTSTHLDALSSKPQQQTFSPSPQAFTPHLNHPQSFPIQQAQSPFPSTLPIQGQQHNFFQQSTGLQSPQPPSQSHMTPPNFPQATASPSYHFSPQQSVSPQQHQGFLPPSTPQLFPTSTHLDALPAASPLQQPVPIPPQPQMSPNQWSIQAFTPPMTTPQQLPASIHLTQTSPTHQSIPSPAQAQNQWNSQPFTPPMSTPQTFSPQPTPPQPQIAQAQQRIQGFSQTLGSQQSFSPSPGQDQVPQIQQSFSAAPTLPEIPQHQTQFFPPPPAQQQFPPTPASAQAIPSLQSQKSNACLAPTEGSPTKYTPFYVLASSTACSVCKNCYLSKVTPYVYLASHFIPYTGPDEQFICDLSYPRVQSLFSKLCLPQNTVQPLIDFGEFFPTLAPCTGETITSSGPMYATKNQMISGFAVCPTCYELYIHNTLFDKHFERMLYNEMHEWNCDMHQPFFKRAYLTCLADSDFTSFAEEANGKINLGSCPGKGQPIGPLPGTDQYLLFTAKGGKTGNICPACYCEYLAYTPLADNFVAAHLGPSQVGTIHCDLSTPYSRVAIKVAIKKEDDEIWRKVIGLDGTLPPCPGAQGVDEELLPGKEPWFQMTSYPNIECCPRCYLLFVELFGASHLFQPISRNLQPGIIRQCLWTESDRPPDTPVTSSSNFETTAAWRGRMFRNCLGVAYTTGSYADLLKVAEILNASPPPCAGRLRGFKRGSGRKWYGRIAQNKGDANDTTIVFCAECHSELVLSTPLQDAFSMDLSEAAYANEGIKGFFCQPYSARSKSMLKDACVSGDLGTFARYWNEREELRKKREAWQPVLAAQDRKQKEWNKGLAASVQLKVSAQANALTMLGGSMIAEAAMGETGVRYGNSVIGMDHLTAGRADAEMAFHNASNMSISGGGGDVMAESRRLLALYERDNQAYLAVE